MPSSYTGPWKTKSAILVSDQVRHKPACTVIEAGWKPEVLELNRRGIALFV